MIDRFLGDAFAVLSNLFWNTVLQCSARLPMHTLKYVLYRAVSGAPFLTAVNGAISGPYVPVLITRALVAHRYTYALPRCRTSLYGMTFIPLTVSLWNDLADTIFDGVGLAGCKSRADALLLA